ncbi:MAG: excinuclease ABC subunit UvrB [SAR202 cluster bacterium]|nr:excinuclease ABC subunit UvrB [SAR202 cluster bacterium]|tara:strand:- start:3018 stop:4994 length:1977 start_codon:yes stop_codon:yes gene_type:complete
MEYFDLISNFKPTGDQPQAIERLVNGVESGERHQTLLGVTGSGKTFTMACAIAELNRPTLVIAHNKTLAAQLASEFKEFFPNNAVEYFVSYYDYYQPEAYVPRTDIYIEKDADINEELDKLRHAATRALLTRKDVLIVASVSCIFGLGSPEEYQGFVARVAKGAGSSRADLIHKLVDMQYERNDYDLSRGKFRVRGDTLEIIPAYEQHGIRIEYWGDEIDRILEMDSLTGEILSEIENVEIYPARHFVTSEEKMEMAINSIQLEMEESVSNFLQKEKFVEAQRLESRTKYDLEMLKETGYCSGIENYSRHLSGRKAGSTPFTLIDYFPEDFLLMIDESHMTLPQIRGMYNGDQSRKRTLVEFGFRLPSALDNRPLNFNEFDSRIHQAIYVSATPGPYEYELSGAIVEQIIRPTGLVDPSIKVVPTKDQIDDLLSRIRERVKLNQRCLVTTLTKRMAEELSEYLREMNINTQYLHSEVDTLQRVEILRDFRLGLFDVVVGINLLREGLDLPEVGLVAILDADKEGYLRSWTALIQTIGRAARNIEGAVVMYADRITDSMRRAIDETDRRRQIQHDYNTQHGVEPKGIFKDVKDITERVREIAGKSTDTKHDSDGISKEDLGNILEDLKKQMEQAAKELEFEKAALLRDQMRDIRKVISE